MPSDLPPPCPGCRALQAEVRREAQAHRQIEDGLRERLAILEGAARDYLAAGPGAEAAERALRALLVPSVSEPGARPEDAQNACTCSAARRRLAAGHKRFCPVRQASYTNTVNR